MMTLTTSRRKSRAAFTLVWSLMLTTLLIACGRGATMPTSPPATVIRAEEQATPTSTATPETTPETPAVAPQPTVEPTEPYPLPTPEPSLTPEAYPTP